MEFTHVYCFNQSHREIEGSGRMMSECGKITSLCEIFRKLVNKNASNPKKP
jgi:hypothetical protein